MPEVYNVSNDADCPWCGGSLPGDPLYAHVPEHEGWYWEQGESGPQGPFETAEAACAAWLDAEREDQG
jgi:hypothetical protein